MAKRDSLQKITTEIAKLTKQREALQQKRRAPALARIVQEMQECGLTIEDVQNALARGAKRTQSNAPRARGQSQSTRGPRRPKDHEFRDPQTGARWTGWGPRPAWLREHIDAGRFIEEFRVSI